MNNSVFLYRVDGVQQLENADNKILKKELKQRAGKTIRRIDQLTRLALVGALRCTEDIILPERTGLIMSSKFGSLNNSLSVLQEIFQEKCAPSPLKFVNTVSNAASFYVAEQLQLSANNIFIARQNFSLEGCLKLAQQDLNSTRLDAVLIGLVEEIGVTSNEDANHVHRQRLGIDGSAHAQEGSHWFLLAGNIEDEKPVAKLNSVLEPLNEAELINHLNNIDSIDTLLLSPRINPDLLLEKIPLQRKNIVQVEHRSEYSSVEKLTELLQQKREQHHKSIVFIDSNKNFIDNNKQQFSSTHFSII